MRFFLILFVSFIFIGCSTDKPNSDNKLLQNLVFSGGENTISIQNTNNTAVRFSMKINQSFPMTLDDLVTHSKQIAIKNNISIEESSWLFVYKNTFHSKPYTSNNWQHNPFLFINSIGGGFCDDRATLLAMIWKKQGLSSRIIRLEGHIVPEVFTDGKWKMYDPDNGVFYCRDNGIVLSVDELAIDSNAFFKTHCSVNTLNPIFQRKNPISLLFSNFFITSTEDNQNDTDWHMDYNKIDTDFILPSHSSLEISHNGVNIVSIRVKLTPKSKGLAKIPFVPYLASGSFTAGFESKKTKINSANYFFPNTNYISTIEITDVNNESEIIYLINSKLPVFSNENAIEIQSDKPITVVTYKANVTPVSFNEAALFFDLKSEKHSDFLLEISDYQGEIDRQLLSSQFKQFISNDNELSIDEQNNLIIQFENDLNEVFQKHSNLKILEQQYPKSAFYLFLASKYKKMEFIHRILSEQL